MSNPILCTSPASKIPESAWLAEMDTLQQKLKKNGLHAVKVGMEIEFSTPYQGKIIPPELTQKLIGYVEEVEQSAAEAKSTKEKEDLLAKAEQMKRFSYRDFLMYELIEKNPRTKDILEYSFGKGQLGAGYYDNPGVFELRLKPTTPEQACANHAVVISEIGRLLDEYNLEFYMQPARHISMSFWPSATDNAMDARSPSHMTTGAHIVEGIARATLDGGVLIRDPAHAFQCKVVGVGTGRSDLLRMADGRIEFRLQQDMKSYQHPESVITLALAGALYGLNAHSRKATEGLIPAKSIKRLTFTGREIPHVTHYLNSFYYSPHQTGKIECDSTYGIIALPDICVELGLLEKGSQDFDAMKEALDWIKKNLDIRKEYPNKDVFQAYREKALRLLELKIENNQPILPDEFAPIAGKLKFNGQHDSFIVEHAYSQNGEHNAAKSSERLKKSKVLSSTLSPSLFDELTKHFTLAHGAPTHAQKMELKEENEMITKKAAIARHGDAPPLP